MAGKISQATPITTLANGDLLDVSQDIGGGAYATKSISYQNLIAQLNSVIADNRLFGLYAQTVQSPTVTNTTTETTIVGAGVGGLTVPANTFSVGEIRRTPLSVFILIFNRWASSIKQSMILCES